MWNLAVSRAGNLLYVLENPVDADRMGWDRIDRHGILTKFRKFYSRKRGWGRGVCR